MAACAVVARAAGTALTEATLCLDGVPHYPPGTAPAPAMRGPRQEARRWDRTCSEVAALQELRAMRLDGAGHACSSAWRPASPAGERTRQRRRGVRRKAPQCWGRGGQSLRLP